MTAEQRARDVEAVAAVLREYYDSADDSDESRHALADLIAAARREGAEQKAWDIKAEAAELLADERSSIYGTRLGLGYAEVEAFGDWCHAWAAQFRSHTDSPPDLAKYRADAIARGDQPQGECCASCGRNVLHPFAYGCTTPLVHR